MNKGKEYYKIAKDYWKKEDYENAKIYYEKACEMEYAKAFNNLGLIYGYDLLRIGIYSDKAMEYYNKSIMLGYNIAKYNLAICYKQKDIKMDESIKLLEDAYKCGYKQSTYMLAYIYLYKLNNINKGLEYLIEGMNLNVGDCYAEFGNYLNNNGKLVIPNMKEKFSFYGESCIINKVIEANRTQIIHLFLKAIENGSYLGIKYLSDLSKNQRINKTDIIYHKIMIINDIREGYKKCDKYMIFKWIKELTNLLQANPVLIYPIIKSNISEIELLNSKVNDLESKVYAPGGLEYLKAKDNFQSLTEKLEN